MTERHVFILEPLDVTETRRYLSYVTRFIVLCGVASEYRDVVLRLCAIALFKMFALCLCNDIICQYIYYNQHYAHDWSG